MRASSRTKESCSCFKPLIYKANREPNQQRRFSGVSQRPLTLILPQKYRDTNGRRIVMQIGGVYATFCHREGIHLQKYAMEMGGVSRYFTCIGVRGRCDSPKICDEIFN